VAPLGRTYISLEGQAPHHRISASLEGLTHPRANLCLARGLDAPSGEFPPRSRDPDPERVFTSLEATLGPRRRICSPDRSIKCSGTSRAPGSKANTHHAGPLTPLGNHNPALFDQPALCDHPWRCAGTVWEGRCYSMTLCRQLPYLLHVAPSKEDDDTLERGTTTYSAPPGMTS
jgi:hypothetical protein